jgi:putative glycosyltransferase (TIGR04372 family)
LAVERVLYRGGRGLPEAVTPLTPIIAVTLDDARALLSSCNWEELAHRLQTSMVAFELVPNVTISPRALALMQVGSFCEAMISDISDMDELVTVLAITEVALRTLIVEAPLWTEGHRFLARNMWFQGRLKEAMACFEDAEACLPKLAEAAGWDPNGRVMLPRNCAHVIGLMGHIDAFVKHKILSGDDRPYYLVAPEHEVVNQVFLDYWKAYLHVDSPPKELAAPSHLEAAYTVNWNWILPQPDGALVHVHRGIARTQKSWHEQDRESLLRLNFLHAEILSRQTAEWGMKPDDWFVCLHVRSAGFYTEQEGTAQHFRNTSIDDYYPMIKFIVETGGWVIRMGEASAPPLDLETIGTGRDRVIDYAHSPQRSAELDVALCASCRLFISSPSGLHTVAHAFGRPVCYVNFPIYAGFPWHPGEIFIPQRYYSRSLERVLTLSEILSSHLVYADHHFLLQRAGVDLLHNTPAEIAETVREALDPEEYGTANVRQARQVREEFDRLNAEHELDISGQLGLYFSSVHGRELCPYIIEEVKRPRRRKRVKTRKRKPTSTQARTLRRMKSRTRYSRRVPKKR